jgi:hypothetical protein
MLLAALFAIQSAAVSVASDDVVVTARRMKRLERIKVVTEYDPKLGTSRCVFKRRSGDRRLDAEVCNIARACASKINEPTEVRACVAPAINALVADGVPWRAEAVTRDR